MTIVLPSNITLSLDTDAVNDVYLATDPTTQDGAYLRHGSAVTEPTDPSVKLGTVNTSDGSTTRASDNASSTFDTVTSNSVNTEDLNGADFISPGDSVSTINSALSGSGLVVFETGDHFLSDRIEVTSASVSVLVLPGAHIKIADGATPTTLTGGDSNTYTPVFYNSGYDDFHVENQGLIDGNQTNHSNPICVFVEDAASPSLSGEGGRFSDHAAAAGIFDSTEVSVSNIEGESSGDQGAVWFEGVNGAEVRDVYCDGGEALDLNSACENIQFHGLQADNSNEVADIHSCSNVQGSDIQAGDGCSNILTVKDTGTSIFTSQSPFGYAEDISIDGIRGTVSGKALQVVGVGSGDLRGVMKFTGIDVVSTGDTAVSIRPDAASQFADGLTLGGYAETESTGTHYAFGINVSSGTQQAGLNLNVEGVSAGSHGVVIGDWNDISGQAVGRDSAGQAVGLFTNSGTVQNVALTAHGYNSDRGINIGGGCSDITVNGRAYNNTNSDIVVGGTDVDVEADWDTRTDNGTRTVWNGLGYNAGDPSSTGDWNGNGREGVHVRDTTNNNTYLYNDGGYSQVASS
jgi:hypothetical protein